MYSTPPVMNLTENPNDVWVPTDYEPTYLDICSGRGKAFWNHAGNVAFRNLIQAQVLGYIEAPTKADKTAIVVSIVDDLRKKGCKFLKQETDPNGSLFWYDIGDALAREKVGHSLRDQVTAINRSNRDGSRSPVPPSKFQPTAVISASPGSFADPSIPQYPYPTSGHSNNMNYVTNDAQMAMPNGTNFQNNINHNQWNDQQYQYQHQNQNQIQPGYEYYYDEHDMSNNHNSKGRRPSLALSDSDNEADMRRSALDTSVLLQDFGRRPSMVMDTFENTPYDQTFRSVTMNDPNNFTTMNSNNFRSKEKLGGLNSQEAKDLITSSIQTIDFGHSNVTNSGSTPFTFSGTSAPLTFSGTSAPLQRSGASRRISGSSTFRMSSSMMRDSTLRLSELSMLSGGFSNMSFQDLGQSITDDGFANFAV